MNVSDVSTETVKMEMDIYNSAGLYIRREVLVKRFILGNWRIIIQILKLKKYGCRKY